MTATATVIASAATVTASELSQRAYEATIDSHIPATQRSKIVQEAVEAYRREVNSDLS